MFKIKNLLNSNSNIIYCLSFSIILFFFGSFLIYNSTLKLLFFKLNSNIYKITSINTNLNIHEDFHIFSRYTNDNQNKQLTSKFIFREDLSINNLFQKSILKNNNSNKSQSSADSVTSNYFSLGNLKLAFNKESESYDLHALSNELDLFKGLKTKKGKFITSILPLVILENENIRAQRKRLLKIKNFLIKYKTLNNNDQNFIQDIAYQYHIDTVNEHKIDTIETLLELVDIIPNSIVIAQAANESGWGTSRFAKDHNALFGEYTFDSKNGVVPIYRNEGEKYLIKFFSSINESIRSYFNNLNTHLAYRNFRDERQQQRKNKLQLDPINLVKYLKPYAKDKNYINTIRSIIETNRLTRFDNLNILTTKS